MRSFTLLLILMFLMRPAFSQPNLEGYNHLGIRGNYTEFNNQASFYGVGLAYHVNVSNRLTLNYHLQFGEDEHNKFHVHSYLGGAGSVLLGISAIGDGEWGGVKALGALFSLIVPEGLAYNAELVRDVYLQPYVNPLGFHLGSEQHFSGEFGSRVRIQLGKLNIMPFLGSEYFYTETVPFGLSCGVTFSYQMSS